MQQLAAQVGAHLIFAGPLQSDRAREFPESIDRLRRHVLEIGDAQTEMSHRVGRVNRQRRLIRSLRGLVILQAGFGHAGDGVEQNGGTGLLFRELRRRSSCRASARQPGSSNRPLRRPWSW